MTAWDRIQRQDLELREAHRRINLLLEEIDRLKALLAQEAANA